MFAFNIGKADDSDEASVLNKHLKSDCDNSTLFSISNLLYYLALNGTDNLFYNSNDIF